MSRVDSHPSRFHPGVNIRVFLLLAAIAIFGAAWSSDRHFQGERTIAGHQPAITSIAVNLAPQTPVLAIPAQIPSGEYLVLLADGATIRLRIPEQLGGTPPESPARNFYSAA